MTIKFILVLLFVDLTGASIMAAQPFDTLAACESERAKLVSAARDRLPQGQGFALVCGAVSVAGKSV